MQRDDLAKIPMFELWPGRWSLIIAPLPDIRPTTSDRVYTIDSTLKLSVSAAWILFGVNSASGRGSLRAAFCLLHLRIMEQKSSPSDLLCADSTEVHYSKKTAGQVWIWRSLNSDRLLVLWIMFAHTCSMLCLFSQKLVFMWYCRLLHYLKRKQKVYRNQSHGHQGHSVRTNERNTHKNTTKTVKLQVLTTFSLAVQLSSKRFSWALRPDGLHTPRLYPPLGFNGLPNKRMLWCWIVCTLQTHTHTYGGTATTWTRRPAAKRDGWRRFWDFSSFLFQRLTSWGSKTKFRVLQIKSRKKSKSRKKFPSADFYG